MNSRPLLEKQTQLLWLLLQEHSCFKELLSLSDLTATTYNQGGEQDQSNLHA